MCTFDVDKNKEMKLPSVMSYTQEAVTRIMEKNGVVADDSVALILIRSSIDINKVPVLGEHLTLKTQFKYGNSAMFYFVNEFLNDKRETLIYSVSAFGCMDKKERRLMKASTLIPDSWREYGKLEYRLKRISEKNEVELIGEHKVVYCEIDYNNHMNNTKYADLCINNLPEHLLKRRIKHFTIDYISECLYGDTVYLYKKEIDDFIYFSGRCNEKTSFDALIEFKNLGE